MERYINEACARLRERYAGRGGLKVAATSGRGALPLAGALVTVEKPVDGVLCRLGEGYTDADGIAEFHELPAWPKSASQDPAGEYAGLHYQVTVEHPLLGRRVGDVAVFDGVKSIWQLAPVRSSRQS